MPRVPSEDDDQAFAEAMRGVRPLPGRSARVEAPTNAPRPRAARPAAPRDPFLVEQLGDTISGRAPDVSEQVLRELRSGRRAVEARVDLHGCTRDRALDALERFLAGARARGSRVGLVVHGRGLGSAGGASVLRPAVWKWLSSAAARRAGVMAFASARPADGGPGATVLLLRR